MPDFESYLMVDWSASSSPSTGPNSVWYCLATRHADLLSVACLKNPATRFQAVSEIKELLLSEAQIGRKVLVGFDFPFGYPAGFAAALGLNDSEHWSGVWREICGRIVDRVDNSNNRFEVAAELNHKISANCYPFWACPPIRQCATLSCTKGGPGTLSEKRITDIGNMQPIWKLYGNGAVGSQALVGIPHVAALRNDPQLAPVSRVWPFETGLRPISDFRESDWMILLCEIYPSLLPADSSSGEVKDAIQVRNMALHFADLDEKRQLGRLFAGSPALTTAEREIVEREEGWTLGVTGARLERQPKTVAAQLVRPPTPLDVSIPSISRRSPLGTTQVGYENRNGQVVIRATGLPGTDHGQSIYVLRCSNCRNEYGANGSEIYQRRCPSCQRGRPGLEFLSGDPRC